MDTTPKIGLVPLGQVREDVLAFLKEHLQKEFGCEVASAAALDVPTNAYDKARKQFHSTALLGKLASYTHMYDRVLGIANMDLFVPGLNFVFGEADTVARVAIISLARLDQRFYCLAEDDDLLFKRTLKEAVHELGHTYGLLHCPDSRCVMFFSNQLADTDQKGASFCPLCQKKLKLKIMVP